MTGRHMSLTPPGTRGDEAAANASSALVGMDALRMELEYYRRYFWSQQESLRRAATHAADVPVNTGKFGEDAVEGCEPSPVASNSAPPSEVAAYAAPGSLLSKYEDEMLRAKCRQLDDEAAALHVHYRQRLQLMSDALSTADDSIRRYRNECCELRQANFALCREVERLLLECKTVSSSAVVERVQQSFLITSEMLWRTKLEAEALQYLVTRITSSSMSPPNPAATATSRHQPVMTFKEGSSRERALSSVQAVVDAFFARRGHFGAVSWAAALEAEDDMDVSITSLQQHTKRFSQSLVESDRRAAAEKRAMMQDVIHSTPLTECDLQKAKRTISAATRHSLSSTDEPLVIESLRRYRTALAAGELPAAWQAMGDNPELVTTTVFPVPETSGDVRHDATSGRDRRPPCDDLTVMEAAAHRRFVAPFFSAAASVDEKQTAELPLLRHQASPHFANYVSSRSAALLDPVISANRKLQDELRRVTTERDAFRQRCEKLEAEVTVCKRAVADDLAAKRCVSFSKRADCEGKADGEKDRRTSPSDKASSRAATPPQSRTTALAQLAKKYSDPKLRDRMLRQMHELNQEVDLLLAD